MRNEHLYVKRLRRRADLYKKIIIGLTVLCAILTAVMVSRLARAEPEKQEPQVVAVPATIIETPSVVIASPGPVETEVAHYPEFAYSKDWDADDAYLLAKLAMAEAEGESVQGKSLVIMVVLNRVWSPDFPDTIHDVIYQPGQFSVIASGRFDRLEPSDECWEAERLVAEAPYDYSGGALYFESCATEDNWHSNNLEYLFQEGNHRFYK